MNAELLIPIAVALVGLIVGSVLFSAIETALFSLQPFHIERLRKRRASFAQALSRLMENPRRLLSTILLADALVNLPLIVLTLFLLHDGHGLQWPLWAAALAVFGLIVFVCDFVPKIAALAEPYRIARIGVRVMAFVTPTLDPVARVLQRLSERIADAVTPARLRTGHGLHEDELSTLIELSAEEGALDESESEIIQEIIKLGDKHARDCLTPRVEVFAVPDDLTHEQLIPMLRARRFRRVPVYGETPDDIIGVLDVRNFLLDPALHYTAQLATPSFVPETMKAITLLRSFLKHPQGLAIVVDEHGGVEGVVTLADIVEEIISDAVPLADRALYIEEIGPGQLVVNGHARLDDINELLGTHFAAEGLDTIGGLIFNQLGALPKPGTTLEVDGVTLQVRRVSRQRVEEVAIMQPQLGHPGEDAAP